MAPNTWIASSPPSTIESYPPASSVEEDLEQRAGKSSWKTTLQDDLEVLNAEIARNRERIMGLEHALLRDLDRDIPTKSPDVSIPTQTIPAQNNENTIRLLGEDCGNYSFGNCRRINTSVPGSDHGVNHSAKANTPSRVRECNFVEFKNRFDRGEGDYAVDVLVSGPMLDQEIHEETRLGNKWLAFKRTHWDSIYGGQLAKVPKGKQGAQGPGFVPLPAREPWHRRIRLQSPALLRIISKISTGDGGEESNVNPQIFIRPVHRQLLECLAKLEQQQSPPNTPNLPTGGKVAMFCRQIPHSLLAPAAAGAYLMGRWDSTGGGRPLLDHHPDGLFPPDIQANSTLLHATSPSISPETLIAAIATTSLALTAHHYVLWSRAQDRDILVYAMVGTGAVAGMVAGLDGEAILLRVAPWCAIAAFFLCAFVLPCCPSSAFGRDTGRCPSYEPDGREGDAGTGSATVSDSVEEKGGMTAGGGCTRGLDGQGSGDLEV